MRLSFNPDGTVDGYNEPKTVEFMQKIGDLVFRQNAKVEFHSLSKGFSFATIFDEDGHECRLCQQKRNAFIELLNEASLSSEKQMLCHVCLYDMLMKLTALRMR